MATTEFIYGERNGRYYPVISTHLRNKNNELDLEVLVDSGASFSTFREEVAELLGINIEEGEKRQSIGISGKIEVYLHQIDMKVFDSWFTCTVAFSRELTSSFNLLGREGFFDRHLISFNQKEKKTIITEF